MGDQAENLRELMRKKMKQGPLKEKNRRKKQPQILNSLL